MSRIGKFGRILLAVALVLGTTNAGAYTVSIGSPTANSTWQAGSSTTLSCSGSIIWVNNPPTNIEMRPTSGIVYLHAGGNGGTATNSAAMSITNIQASSEDWSASMALIPTTPPTYGGGNNRGMYTVEADAQVAGAAVASDWVQISVYGG